jgi:two-component system CheB/CheR fusion protein
LGAARETSAVKENQRRAPLIVGVGASAGGLEAVQDLLKAASPDSGTAFVLIHHLDPERASGLPGILSGATTMPVVQATDGMAVERDHVYIIPSDADITVEHDVLRLVPRGMDGGLHLPVNRFLRSLAIDRGVTAAGVVLSGTGADGTDGLSAVKSHGGRTFAQDAASAAFSGMPVNAIRAGVVDVVDTPAGIARALRRSASGTADAGERDTDRSTAEEEAEQLKGILQLLKKAPGVDFEHYRTATVLRRIRRRMGLRCVEDLAEYARILLADPVELAALHKDLLIMVTSFFRDPVAFEALKVSVFPSLAASVNGEARMWVIGCGTGQEAYSLMMAFSEYCVEADKTCELRVFASDVSQGDIDFARTGVYPEAIAEEVGEERLGRFFTRTDAGYVISSELRDKCVFARHDITRDPPFSRLDLVSCRNVMIYFTPMLQRRTLQIIHYALRPGGFLLLGGSEGVTTAPALFAPVDVPNKVFARTGAASQLPGDLQVPIEWARPMHDGGAIDIQPVELERAIGEMRDRLGPAAVVIGPNLRVLSTYGTVSPYLELPRGMATLDVLAMAREGLAGELHTAITESKETGEAVSRSGIHVADADRSGVTIDVTPVPHPTISGLLLIAFSEESRRSTKSRGGKRATTATSESDRSRQALAGANEALRLLRQEKEAAVEELRATIEAGQSGNEELQSINEELETAKEELQSTNEELLTLNDELRGRNRTLAELNDDLSNLLASTGFPTVMVDREGRVRRFTADVTPLLNVIPSDVGRPLTDIRPNVDMGDLGTSIASVVRSGELVRRDVLGPDGRWLSVVTRPYLTSDHVIDGAIISFADIHDMKLAQTSVERSAALLSALTAANEVLNGAMGLHDAMGQTLEAARVAVGADWCEVVVEEQTRWVVAYSAGARARRRGTPLDDVAAGKAAPAVAADATGDTGCVVKRQRGSRTTLLSAPVLLDRKRYGAVTFAFSRLDPAEAETRFAVQFAVACGLAMQSARHKELLASTVAERTAQLQDTVTELERALHAKDRFLADMSHELRTPLNSIIGFSTVILQGMAGELAEEERKQVEMIQTSGRQLLYLVNGLLDLATIQSGGAEVVRTEFGVRGFLESVRDGVEELARAKGLGLRVVLARADMRATTDEDKLRQVLLNIVSNAIKFTESGTVTVRVAKSPRGQIAFTVTDTGPGIPEEEIAQIREPFRQFPRGYSAKPSGAGLGLAISASLLEALGGDLEIRSVVGEGSVFQITVPSRR